MPHIRTFFLTVTANIKKLFGSFVLTTPLAIIIASVILGGSHIIYGALAQGNATSASVLFAGKPVDASDYVEGNEKSKVTIVEYSDPECPFCVTLYPTLKQIRDEYKDKISFVYRHFPLTQIHPHAFDESKAIACAGILGGKDMYYEYMDALYNYKSAQQTTQLPVTGKTDLALNVGLDKVAFENCLANPTTGAIIDAATNDGVQAGVQGTPSTFILLKTKKGYETITMVDGARPYEYVKAAVDEALSR
ncbi:MAG: DsbA family protein [Candidatus Paceibacterota bacterium]